MALSREELDRSLGGRATANAAGQPVVSGYTASDMRGGPLNAAQASSRKTPYVVGGSPDVERRDIGGGGAEAISHRMTTLAGGALRTAQDARERQAPELDMTAVNNAMDVTTNQRAQASGRLGQAEGYQKDVGYEWDAAKGKYRPVMRDVTSQYGDVSQAAAGVGSAADPYLRQGSLMSQNAMGDLNQARGYTTQMGATLDRGAGQVDAMGQTLDRSAGQVGQMGGALDASIGQRATTAGYLGAGQAAGQQFQDQYGRATGTDYGRAEGAYGAGQSQLDVLRQAQSGMAPSVAQQQLRAGMEDATRAQLAASLSGGFNPAAQAIAAQEAGRLQAETNQAAAQLRAEEIATARGQTSEMIGAQQGAAQGIAGLTAQQQQLLLGQQAAEAERAGLSLQQEQAMQAEAAARGQMAGLTQAEAAARGEMAGLTQAEAAARGTMAGIEQASAGLRLDAMGQQANLGNLALGQETAGVDAMLGAGEMGLNIGAQELAAGQAGAGIAADQAGIANTLAGTNLAIGQQAQAAGELGLNATLGAADTELRAQTLNDQTALANSELAQNFYGMSMEPLVTQYQGDMTYDEMMMNDALAREQLGAEAYNTAMQLSTEADVANTQARNEKRQKSLLGWLTG